MYDLIIKNGTIVDGTGGDRYEADIAIRGEEILEIRPNLNVEPNAPVIDASGLLVTPGFIDMHSHSDCSLLVDSDLKSALYQGITTEVIGNCGFSCYPVLEATKHLLQSYLAGIGYDRSHPLNWIDFEGYMVELQKSGIGINIVSLVGHGSIRIAVMGFDSREATEGEQEEMRRLLRSALEQGAYGLSTGLVYPPGINSPAKELEDLCRVVAEEDGVYSTHLRGDSLRAGPTLVESLKEALEVAEKTGVTLQISHIAPKFPNNGASQTVIDMMGNARRKGLKVSCDVHPYMAAMTFLASLLPPWIFEKDIRETIRRLTDREERLRILKDLKSQFGHLDLDRFWALNELISFDRSSRFAGKRINEIGDMISKDPSEAALDLLTDAREDLWKVGVLEWIYTPEDTLRTFLWPFTMIGADGASSSKETDIGFFAMHPRSWGTFPKVINQYCKEERQIKLEAVIHKMTGLPSAILGLRDRGFIKKGMKADLVIFNLAEMRERTTYMDPRQYSEGVKYLLVNGGFAIRSGKTTGLRLGKVLRKRSSKL